MGVGSCTRLGCSSTCGALAAGGELYPNPNLYTLTLTRRQVGELYLEPLLKELAGSGPGVTGKKE